MITCTFTDIPSLTTCYHGRRLSRCSSCSKFTCQIPGCKREGHRFAGAYVLMRHMRNVHSGETRALTKRKELEVHFELEKEAIEFNNQHDLPFKGCNLEGRTSCCYVDFSIEMPWGTLLLEVDEDQHFNYPPECDIQRDMNIAASIALGSQTKVVMLRYNADNFCINNDVQRLPKKVRLKKLIATMREYQLEDPAPDIWFARRFLFYDMLNGELEISQQWPQTICDISEAVI